MTTTLITAAAAVHPPDTAYAAVLLSPQYPTLRHDKSRGFFEQIEKTAFSILLKKSTYYDYKMII